MLLKPDCLELGLVGEVERAIAAQKLVITCRHHLTLNAGDIRFLWSEYSDAGNALTLALLDRYLTHEPSEVLHLRGPDAFEAARRVKRTIRSRHAEGPFANVVHAAERRGELARQVTRLLWRCEACSSPFVSGEDPNNAPRPHGEDFRALVDLPKFVDDVWPSLREAEAPPPFRLGPGVAGTAVYLGWDPAHSLDSAVTALRQALPGIHLAHALLHVLHASRTGDHPVATGDPAALEHCVRALAAHGFHTTRIGPYRTAATAWVRDPDHEQGNLDHL
ncbi:MULTISPECIES: hypothetical protein [Actinoplanes]|uniref:hypothetical protein n=1 Tax=Actinoplanes TaxID=1865 RepID=UPI0005F2C72E|nr:MULTISPECIES: hypothetical protein [Actinoplanes]GLY00426.1 hypothetical protein Acsp01_08050 [Actinoplanes sp. NBRC 101535]